MVEFADATVMDLVRATEFIHHIRPKLKDKIVVGIEKARPLDQSVVFHLKKMMAKQDEPDTDDKELFIISAEYILEHSFWKAFNR